MTGLIKLVIACIAAAHFVAGGGCGSVKADQADASIPRDSPEADTSIPPEVDASIPQVCTPGMALRCEGDNLISCNPGGTAEVSQTCALGCNSPEKRCTDIVPSNGLGTHLVMTAGEPGVGFNDTATVDTNACAVAVGGVSLSIKSAFLTESSGLKICILIVGSLTTLDVTTTGNNALAIVSNGDIKIQGTFSVSASGGTAGPGARPDSACVGGNAAKALNSLSGAGGGGFGSSGGGGGSATNSGNGQNAVGGVAGGTTGDETLVPLRGGCDSGTYTNNNTSYIGRGGGALQLVSRTRIVISGTVAANGSSVSGGGSGGGILLEAPAVAVPGSAVANGGGGAAGSQVPRPGEAGHLDALPAAGGTALSPSVEGNGGNGAAGTTAATAGVSVSTSNSSLLLTAGHGGGGVGRIRINVAPAGFVPGPVVSPQPTVGTLATQ
jgi:hypothetical protein